MKNHRKKPQDTVENGEKHMNRHPKPSTIKGKPPENHRKTGGRPEKPMKRNKRPVRHHGGDLRELQRVDGAGVRDDQELQDRHQQGPGQEASNGSRNGPKSSQSPGLFHAFEVFFSSFFFTLVFQCFPLSSWLFQTLLGAKSMRNRAEPVVFRAEPDSEGRSTMVRSALLSQTVFSNMRRLL